VRKIKIVIIGAGSASFGGGILVDLLSCEELKELELTITLVDIDKEVLERMYRFAELLKGHYSSRARIEATTDREEALPSTHIWRKRWSWSCFSYPAEFTPYDSHC